MFCTVTTYSLCTQRPHLLVGYAWNINSLEGLPLPAPNQLSEQPCEVDIMVPIL